MIARLTGILAVKNVTCLVVDCAGVGYAVAVPLTTFYELPESGQPVTLHIHTAVREDDISLFGFATAQERELFQVMISVSGIGPKLALNILSGIAPADFVGAVVQGDVKRLVAIPGVGRKLAERLIVELKDKAVKLGHTSPLPAAARPAPTDDLRDDALSALVNLGYKPAAAKEAVEKALAADPGLGTLDALLKQVLKRLAG